MIAKRYLGDSVYVEIEGGMLKLTTENGLGASNTIFMEPEVFHELQRYYKDAVSTACEPVAADTE